MLNMGFNKSFEFLICDSINFYIHNNSQFLLLAMHQSISNALNWGLKTEKKYILERKIHAIADYGRKFRVILT